MTQIQVVEAEAAETTKVAEVEVVRITEGQATAPTVGAEAVEEVVAEVARARDALAAEHATREVDSRVAEMKMRIYTLRAGT